MTVRKLLRAAGQTVAAAALLAAANPASAAVTLGFNPAGSRLASASGVVANGSIYNVTFGDTNVNPMAFSFGGSTTAALAAAQALLDQVFLNSGPALTGGGFAGSNAYDTNPGLTLGCGGSNVCNVLIPIALNGSNLTVAYAINQASSALSALGLDGTGTITLPATTDGIGDGNVTFASFSFQGPSAVPEPATWLLMIAGFGVAASALRRRKLAGAGKLAVA